MIPAALHDQELRRGVVHSYDSAAGYGWVRDGEGDWWFHCTAIAGGTRDIALGTAVVFSLTPGREGRFEAAALTPTA